MDFSYTLQISYSHLSYQALKTESVDEIFPKLCFFLILIWLIVSSLIFSNQAQENLCHERSQLDIPFTFMCSHAWTVRSHLIYRCTYFVNRKHEHSCILLVSEPLFTRNYFKLQYPCILFHRWSISVCSILKSCLPHLGINCSFLTTLFTSCDSFLQLLPAVFA